MKKTIKNENPFYPLQTLFDGFINGENCEKVEKIMWHAAYYIFATLEPNF